MFDGLKGFLGIPKAGASDGFSFGVTNQTRDAARHDLSEFSGWRPSLRFSGGNYSREWDTITGRARDLDENNGWVNGGLDRRVETVIGVNIRLSAQPVHELLNRDYEWRMKWTADVQSRFKVWANDIDRRCDARKKLTFGALAKLAYLSYIRDGEAAAEIRDSKRGLQNPTNILLIEPERISTPDTYLGQEGPRFRNGIEFDGDGAAVAYWVRSGHPQDPNPNWTQTRWDRIPAQGKTGRAKFLHVFSPRRVEQNRGISRLAEVMVPAKMLDRVDRAEVAAALKSAMMSFFIKSPGSTEDLEAALAPSTDITQLDPWVSAYLDYRERTPVIMDGAQINHLLPDEDVVIPNASHPNSNYGEFAKHVLQKISGSLGLSYPQLSQDWAGINYSSARAMLNELWRSYIEDRTFFTQAFLTPIYAAWLEMEVANGTVKIPGGPANFYRNKTAICMAEWIGPGRGSVDPLKEANANNLDTAAGRKSTVECILETGRDPVDVMSEEQWFLAEREARGLSDPNHNVKTDAAGDAGESETGATKDDHDGDGKPNEEKQKKGKPAGSGSDQGASE
jgi:lambda family phage portal protein